MNSVLVVKDFKQTEIARTVNLFLQYESCIQVKLYNYLLISLLKKLSTMSVEVDPCVYVSRYELFTKKVCWFDLLVLSNNIRVSRLENVRRKNEEYIKASRISILLFKIIKILILRTNKMKIVTLPNTSSIYTLLRSPHTDKKSREQYRKSEFKKLISMRYVRSFLLFVVKKESITSKIRGVSFLGN